MSVYLIVNATVTDPESMQTYFANIGPTLQGRRFEVLVSTDDAVTVEGEPSGPRVVVMRFPDRAAFHEWYDSPEYQEVLQHRLKGTTGFAVVADGRD
jgi:uncharacterized protein (DUF1330 family)